MAPRWGKPHQELVMNLDCLRVGFFTAVARAAWPSAGDLSALDCVDTACHANAR